MFFSAILFDLDDTLLRNNSEQFVKTYFQTLFPRVSDYFNEKEFVSVMTGATRRAIQVRRGNKCIREVYADYFEQHAPISFSVLERIAKDYYQKEYLNIERLTYPVPGAQNALRFAAEITSHLVLATVPIFPKTAIKERMRWAGIAKIPFSLITSYEIMHVSKPHPDYYVEICEKLSCEPSDCLMIGNDYQDDMSARAAGLKTFLVTDYAIGDTVNGFEPHYSGCMNDLLVFLRNGAIID